MHGVPHPGPRGQGGGVLHPAVGPAAAALPGGLLAYVDTWTGADTIAGVRDNIWRRPARSRDQGVKGIAEPILGDVIRAAARRHLHRIPDLALVGIAGGVDVRGHRDRHVRPGRRARHRHDAAARLPAVPRRTRGGLGGAAADDRGPGRGDRPGPLVGDRRTDPVLAGGARAVRRVPDDAVPRVRPRARFAVDRGRAGRALVALAMWIGGFLLRLCITSTIEGRPSTAPSRRPIAVLLWIGVSASRCSWSGPP